MTKKRLAREKQCAKCPFKTSTNPHDIPHGYSERMHRGLSRTIAEPGSLRELASGKIRAMACHESPIGEESYCIGWLEHQLGPGNNIGLRIKMMNYDLSNVETFGEQHQCFEDTLPDEEE